MLAVVACTLAEPLPGGHGWHHGGHGGHGHGGGGKGHGGHGGGGKGHGGHGHGGHGGGKGHGGHGGGGKGHGGHGGHGWWSICGSGLIIRINCPLFIFWSINCLNPSHLFEFHWMSLTDLC